MRSKKEGKKKQSNQTFQLKTMDTEKLRRDRRKVVNCERQSKQGNYRGGCEFERCGSRDQGANEGRKDEQEVINLELERLGLLPCVVGVTCGPRYERSSHDKTRKK